MLEISKIQQKFSQHPKQFISLKSVANSHKQEINTLKCINNYIKATSYIWMPRIHHPKLMNQVVNVFGGVLWGQGMP